MKVRELLCQIAVGVAVTLIGGLVTGAIPLGTDPRPPLARFTCDNPSDGEPLLVRCHDSSEYASTVVWDFGDGSGPETRNGTPGPIEHLYRDGGPYTIRLTALGKGSEKQDVLPWEVWVHGPRNQSFEPFQVSLRAQTHAAVERVVKEVPFEIIRDKHKLVGNSSEDYSVPFTADEGFVIVDHELDLTSVNHFEDRDLELHPDAGELRWSLTLTSGPKLDSWRGWARGTMRLVQERQIESDSIWLAENLTLEGEGLLPLPSALMLDTVREIEVVDSAGAVLAAAEPGRLLALEDRGLGLNLEDRDGALSLRVERLDSSSPQRGLEQVAAIGLASR